MQRLYSIMDKQMAEASRFFTISNLSEEEESLDRTPRHATCHIRHEGRLTLKRMFENFLLSRN